MSHVARVRFFPPELPDEVLMSIVARYDLLSGNRSSFVTLSKIFGSGVPVTFTGLPSRIGALFNRLPADWAASCLDLIERVTLVPYFRPFLSREQVKEAIRHMISAHGSGIKAGIGLSASRVGAAEVPRYCPECIVYDFNEYGFPYWHRSHMLPGVFICPQHEVNLRELKFSPNRPSRHGLFLPPHIEGQFQKDVCPSFSSEQQKVLAIIAQNSQKLLQSGLDTLSRQEIIKVYKDRYSKLNFLSANGSVRQKALHDFVLSFYSDIKAIAPFRNLLTVQNLEHSWIASLLRDRQKCAIRFFWTGNPVLTGQ